MRAALYDVVLPSSMVYLCVGIMLIRSIAESRDSAIAAWRQPLDQTP